MFNNNVLLFVIGHLLMYIYIFIYFLVYLHLYLFIFVENVFICYILVTDLLSKPCLIFVVVLARYVFSFVLTVVALPSGGHVLMAEELEAQVMSNAEPRLPKQLPNAAVSLNCNNLLAGNQRDMHSAAHIAQKLHEDRTYTTTRSDNSDVYLLKNPVLPTGSKVMLLSELEGDLGVNTSTNGGLPVQSSYTGQSVDRYERSSDDMSAFNRLLGMVMDGEAAPDQNKIVPVWFNSITFQFYHVLLYTLYSTIWWVFFSID